MLAKAGCALLCLPLVCWFLGMILWGVLPHAVFWLLVVALAIWAGRAIVRLGKA